MAGTLRARCCPQGLRVVSPDSLEAEVEKSCRNSKALDFHIHSPCHSQRMDPEGWRHTLHQEMLGFADRMMFDSHLWVNPCESPNPGHGVLFGPTLRRLMSSHRSSVASTAKSAGVRHSGARELTRLIFPPHFTRGLTPRPRSGGLL